MTELLLRPEASDGPRDAALPRARRGGRWVDVWEPEDPLFWAQTGRRTACRNLGWSIVTENLGFSIWLLWSVVVVQLPAAGFAFTTDQLFWLVSLPNLVGAFLRLPYTVAVPRFGGRNWTVVSTLLLLLPVGMLVVAVTDPSAPYWFFLLAAACAGLGGGNFASSMANISFFFPERRKGLALGLNAAGGNLGVAMVQVGVPALLGLGWLAVVGTGQADGLHLQNAGLVFVPLVVLAAFGAWRCMDNLHTATSSLREQVVVARRAQTWIVSVLYVGTFGSFIGFAAAMPLLIKTEFPDVRVASYAFLGALIGSLSRPLGGWLADRLGGARVTACSFAGMVVGAALVWWCTSSGAGFGLFLSCFIVLFIASGIGNGSTFRMIPVIFRVAALRDAAPGEGETAALRGRRESASVLGLVGAVGAFGGFFVPRGFGSSLSHTGSVGTALLCFLCFYAGCLALTWWCYLRRNVLIGRFPNLSDAHV